MSLTDRREIWWTPAYDKRDPNPSKNYGVHGMEITFVLRTPDFKQGLTFTLMTNWHLPHVTQEMRQRGRLPEVLPASVALHTLAPADEPASISTCQVVGGPCRGDGGCSFTLGDEFFKILVTDGIEALWSKMQATLDDWSKPS